jgi:mono/diheme cytochrome c family protein
MPRPLVAVLALTALLIAAPTDSRTEDIPPDANGVPKEIPKQEEPAVGWSLQNIDPEQQQRMLRFSTFVNGGIPHEYSTAENTVGYTVRAIAEGGTLYQSHCQKCHGVMGLGNGDLAYSLKPSPALLAYMVQQPVAVDQYLLWSIAEGGKQFGTAMPGFKNQLSQEQIFQIVAYLRAGFPDVENEAPVGTKGGPGAASTDEPDPKTHTID